MKNKIASSKRNAISESTFVKAKTNNKQLVAELVVANLGLVFQCAEKEKRASKLFIDNAELVHKSKRASDLIITNKDIVIQNLEEKNRIAELIIFNIGLAYKNKEKERYAMEHIIASDEMIKAEEQFQLVVDAVPNAIILINGEGVITMVNTHAEKIFEYSRHELFGNKFEILIPDRFRQQHPSHRNVFFEEPRTHASQNLFALKKNGIEIPIEIKFNLVETAKGYMVLVSLIDITDQKNQEATLKKQNKELEQFAHVASHDLQEPLRTVSNYMELLEEDYFPLLDDKARGYVNSINRATQRMRILITSLLEFSRLGHNKMPVYTDCNELIDDVLMDLAAMIKKSGALIDVAEMPTLNLYEIEIQQLFQNLITNAIKFCKRDTPPKIQIRASKMKDSWIFSIRDNGIGIAPDSFDRVFDIFQRLHTTEKYEGSGIGLANCKKIVQLHKGMIWIESILGQGTTFFFTISNLEI